MCPDVAGSGPAPPISTAADGGPVPVSPGVRVAMDKLESLIDGSRTLPEALGVALLAGVDAGDLVEATRQLGLDDLSWEIDGRDQDLKPYRSQIALFEDARLLIRGDPGQRGRSAQRAVNAGRLAVVGDPALQTQVSSLVGRAGNTAVVALEPDATADIATFAGDGSALRARLVVGCFNGQRSETAEALNRICVDLGLPLLIYRSYPLSVALGPLIVPGETGCLHCLLQRERAVRGIEDLGTVGVSEHSGAMNFPFALDILAFEAVRWLAGADVSTLAKVWRLDLLTASTHISPVLKLPRCEVCGVHHFQPPRRLWEE